MPALCGHVVRLSALLCAACLPPQTQALLVHLEGVEQSLPSSSAGGTGNPGLALAAAEAASAALQSLHALASGVAGMEALLACPEFVPGEWLVLAGQKDWQRAWRQPCAVPLAWVGSSFAHRLHRPLARTLPSHTPIFSAT